MVKRGTFKNPTGLFCDACKKRKEKKKTVRTDVSSFLCNENPDPSHRQYHKDKSVFFFKINRSPGWIINHNGLYQETERSEWLPDASWNLSHT